MPVLVNMHDRWGQQWVGAPDRKRAELPQLCVRAVISDGPEAIGARPRESELG